LRNKIRTERNNLRETKRRKTLYFYKSLRLQLGR